MMKDSTIYFGWGVGGATPYKTMHICMCPDGAFLTLPGSVLIVLNESGQAKVSNLTHQAITNQNVSRTQVSVNVVHPLDVGHASSHLNTQTLTLKTAEQSQILYE